MHIFVFEFLLFSTVLGPKVGSLMSYSTSAIHMHILIHTHTPIYIHTYICMYIRVRMYIFVY